MAIIVNVRRNISMAQRERRGLFVDSSDVEDAMKNHKWFYLEMTGFVIAFIGALLLDRTTPFIGLLITMVGAFLGGYAFRAQIEL